MNLSFQPVTASVVTLAASAILFAGCSTMSGARGTTSRGYLRFEIEPTTAEVEIDEEYSGLVSGWVQETIPVKPGLRKVTVRAPGYLTQRFDIEVATNEEVTLVLNMERALALEPTEEPAEPTFSSRVGRER